MEHRRHEFRQRTTLRKNNGDVIEAMRKERKELNNKRIRLTAFSSINIIQQHQHHQQYQQQYGEEERIQTSNDDNDNNNIHDIIENIQNTSMRIKLNGLMKLRQLTCTSNWPIDEIISTGIIDCLISLLTSSDHNIQHESIWCLTNIASGNHQQTGVILKAVPILLQILASSNPILQDQASWTLGNIAGDSDEYRHVLIANGAVKPLMEYALVSASTSLMYQGSTEVESYSERARTAVWALSNLTRGSTPAAVFMNLEAIASLIELMTTILTEF